MPNFNNWEGYKEALLEGMDTKKRDMMSTVMESAHKENVKTKDNHNDLVTEDATGVNNISRYDMMFMPIIRRTMPSLLAMDLVGVQPLNGPRGIARTLRFRYGETTDDGSGTNSVVTAGDEASGENVFHKYSKLASGDAYDAVDSLNPFEQTQHLESDGGKPMNLEVVTDSVETMSRKLSATYTLEAADDLGKIDGLNIESELSQSLGDQILRELDRELLGELHGLAGTTTPFDFDNVDGRYAGEKLSAMTIAFDNLSAEISMKTRKSGATWMVVSRKVFTGLKNAADSSFVPANSGEIDIGTSLYVGTFGANIAVYVDPYAETDTVLMGYKGSSELDTGFVYCPYIPLSSSGVIVDPTNGDHRLLMRTRYGLHKFTDPVNSLGDSPDYYARATIANIELGFKNI